MSTDITVNYGDRQPITINYTGVTAASGGDMLKSVYDTNNDGIVNAAYTATTANSATTATNATQFNNQSPSYYLSRTNHSGNETALPFSTGYTPTGSEPLGSIFWNPTNGGLEYVIDAYGNITIGNEEWGIYTNLSGTTLVNGDVVSIVGAAGNRSAMTLTDATNQVQSLGCIGMVTVPTILNNNAGRITRSGQVHELNTSTYNEGDVLYVDPANPGKLTSVAPIAPNYSIRVGVVTVKHATQGVVDVDIVTYPKITDLADVNGTPLTSSGQIPVWDNTQQFFDFSSNINSYVQVIDKEITPVTINNSNVETIVYTYTVPGGTLDTDSLLNLHIKGYLVNNYGTSQNMIVNAYFGGSKLEGPIGTASIATGTTKRDVNINLWLANDGALNSQYGSFMVDLATTNNTGNTAETNLAIDTSSDQALVVTITLAQATNMTFKMQRAWLELIK